MSDDPTLPPEPALDQTQMAGDSVPSRDRAASPVQRGETVGRYVVLDVLGRGGMGVVYAAFDPELDRKVALKLLHPEVSTEGSMGSARLLREAQAMAKLSHPNVITVHDVGTLGQDVFVAMEFVAGLTLDDWREKTTRTWREILDVFVQAGQGLAAAHRVGLVHRDFKPDNVMVGDDGRVRVMDFGLARPAGATIEIARETETKEDPLSSTASSLLTTPITMTGALMGTPAYMAPEQHLGHDTDARADQFGFCVGLYEAVYGRRPFRGESLATLAFQVVQGKVIEPPRDAGVPSFVWHAVRRGLSRRADDRYPDMDALLADLQRDPGASRRRVAIGAGFAAALALGAWGVSASQPESPCGGAQARLVGVWDDDVRGRLADAFEASDLPYADDAWSRTHKTLDAYAEYFVLSHEDACVATNVRHEQSPALLDRRMACLDTRLAELEGLVESLAEPDAERIAKAPDAAAALSSLALCSDLEALMREVPPPNDPTTRAQVEAIELALGRIKGMYEAGQYTAAMPLAREQLAAAEATGYGPVIARAHKRVAALHDEFGDAEAASKNLHLALPRAIESGDDALAGDIAVDLAYIDAYRLARYDQADGWLEMAEAWARRFDDDYLHAQALNVRGLVLRDQDQLDAALAAFEQCRDLAENGDDPRLRARRRYVQINIGETLRRLGRYEEAVAAHERARELIEAEVGASHPDAGTLLNNLAMAHSELGHVDQAEQMLTRALAIREAAYGRQHRDVAGTIANLGTVAVNHQDYEKARALFTEALDIFTRTAGREHLFAANMLNNLGLAEQNLGDSETAIEHYEEALAIERKLIGDDAGKLAVAEMNLGVAYSALDRMDEATEHTARALELARTGLGEKHPHTGVMHSTHGNMLAKLDRHEEALAMHSRGREILEAALGPDHLYVGYAVQGVGDDLLELGRPDEAIEPLEAALRIRSGENVAAQEVGEATFSLAQALWRSGGDKARAIELAHRGRDAMERAEIPSAVEEIEAWLKKHRV